MLAIGRGGQGWITITGAKSGWLLQQMFRHWDRVCTQVVENVILFLCQINCFYYLLKGPFKYCVSKGGGCTGGNPWI